MARNIARESVGFVLDVLSIFGMYPTEILKIPKPILFIYTWFLHIFVVTMTPVLSIGYAVAERITDRIGICNTVFMTGEMIVNVIKYAPMRMFPNHYKELIESINRPIFTSYLAEQEHYIDETINFIKKATIFLFAQIQISLITVLLRPFFNDSNGLPVEIWSPLDFKDHKYWFWFVGFCVNMCMVHTALGNSALDILIPTMYSHAATQLRILKDTLQHLGRRTDEKVTQRIELNSDQRQKLRNTILYEEICHCVDHYDAIADFVKRIEKSFAIIVLPQIVASVVIICLTFLQLSILEPTSFEFYQVLSFSISICVEIYLFSYYGTVLYEESNSITNAIYMGDWYEFDLKSKKALIILMERTKRPLKCTAAVVVDITLETFTSTLKWSYSLMAVMKNM